MARTLTIATIPLTRSFSVANVVVYDLLTQVLTKRNCPASTPPLEGQRYFGVLAS